MKVLFLANIPSPYRVDFFNELGKYCDLTVTYEGQNATDRNSKWKSGEAIGYTPIFLKGIRTGFDNFFCPGIIKVIEKKWDRIIVGVYSSPTSMIAIEYMRLKKINFWLQSDGGFIKKDNLFKDYLKRHYISSANKWLTTGKVPVDYLVHYGAQRENCYIYPFTSVQQKDLEYADDLKIKGKDVYRKELGITEEKVVISVGRFANNTWYRKGYDTLMDVAEMLDSTIGVYIIGDDPIQKFLDLKREKKLEHVHFVGFKAKEELAKYYAAADIFVLMTREDIWGLVINEAMSFSLPIITTNKCIAGTELVESGKNGLIVKVDETVKVAESINSLLLDELDKLKDYSNKSREKIKEYTIETMAKAHMEILEIK